ncbi:MAG: hypothetical protein JXA97_11590 [Anaerolineales bacterium]|nr:hypothetical protein [Anaerolineales bacterium]
MNGIVDALAPAFVVSLAIQQFIELLDPVLDRFLKPQKAWLLSLAALAVSILLSVLLNLRVLHALGVQTSALLDVILTGLFLTGGTRGINDLLKIIDYRKETVKAAARRAQGSDTIR